MSDVAQEAAAVVTGDFLAELAQYATDDDEAGTPEQPTVAAAPDAHEAAFTLDPELPEDLRAMLEESEEPVEDDDDEDDEPVAAQVDEYEDEDVARLRRQLAKEVGRREKAEKLRLQDSRKRWETEATKFFPLSSPKTIQATSHRAFLRAANQQHAALKPVFEQALAAREAELRADAAASWGKPMGGPGQVPAEAKEGMDRVQAARDRGSFKDTIKALLETGQVRL